MVTAAKQRQLALELDTRVRYLRLTGLDDAALVAAMSDRMADIQALLDAAGPSGMDALPQRCPTCADSSPYSPAWWPAAPSTGPSLHPPRATSARHGVASLRGDADQAG